MRHQNQPHRYHKEHKNMKHLATALLILSAAPACLTARPTPAVVPIAERTPVPCLDTQFLDESGPQPEHLYVCGIHQGKFDCIPFQNFMKYYEVGATMLDVEAQR
jgi:hypothetical protein